MRTALFVIAAGCAPPRAEPPRDDPAVAQTSSPGKLRVRFDAGAGFVPLWVDRPLDEEDPSVERAIVVVHGSRLNSDEYFDWLADAVPERWRGRTLLIAPEFQRERDARWDELGWDDDWTYGGASGGLSSFAVVDALVRTLRSGRFPNLDWIVIGGHSAGGQFTQRYAAFTDIDELHRRNGGLVKFVVANPSSYAYLNEYRWDDGEWIVPEHACAGDEVGYDEWKYGLEHLTGYAAARGAEWAREHFPKRPVEVLSGTEDVRLRELDESCAALWQGADRRERAELFAEFMDRFYAPHGLTLTDVPGVGHDAGRMLGSPEGVAAFFGGDE